MKAFILTLSLFFLSHFTFAQTKLTPLDSIASDVNSLKLSVKALKMTNDSLNKELYYYRTKEDYYSTLYSGITTHFEWFVTIGLGILGLISFGYFELRIRITRKDVNRELSQVAKIIPTLEEKAGIVYFHVYKNAGFLHAITGIQMESKKQESIEQLLESLKIYKDIQTPEAQNARKNIKTQIEHLNQPNLTLARAYLVGFQNYLLAVKTGSGLVGANPDEMNNCIKNIENTIQRVSNQLDGLENDDYAKSQLKVLKEMIKEGQEVEIEAITVLNLNSDPTLRKSLLEFLTLMESIKMLEREISNS